ncbi:transposase [Methanocella conradii]|uniref:transposase n=1 Tax=Methanocella conradii TaxID=1175444 RepID=UPI0026706BD3|nr:transposase [Methanocella conradii]
MCFNGASWQMCNVHFRRLALKSVPMKDRKTVNSLLKNAMESPEDLQRLGLELESRHSRVSRLIDKYYYDLFNYQAYPGYMWKKLRTTNMLESTIEEIKWRSKVIGAFPNPESAMRIATTIPKHRGGVDKRQKAYTHKNRPENRKRNKDRARDTRLNQFYRKIGTVSNKLHFMYYLITFLIDDF